MQELMLLFLALKQVSIYAGITHSSIVLRCSVNSSNYMVLYQHCLNYHPLLFTCEYRNSTLLAARQLRDVTRIIYKVTN